MSDSKPWCDSPQDFIVNCFHNFWWGVVHETKGEGCWLLTCMDPIKEPPCWFADPSQKLGLKLFGLVVTPRWLRESCSIKTLQWQLGGTRGCKRNWEALINFHAVGGGVGWAHCGSICYTQWPRFAQMPQLTTISQQQCQNIENATLVFSWLSLHIHYQSHRPRRVRFGKD